MREAGSALFGGSVVLDCCQSTEEKHFGLSP